MRTKQLAYGAIFASVTLIAGCSSGENQEHQAGPAICRDGRFDWKTSEKWTLVVLDDLETIEAGGTLHAEAKPYRPRTARVEGVSSQVPKNHVVESLAEHLQKNLAAVGERTSDQARSMSADFPEKGQAVYYRGVLSIEAEYKFTCPTDRASEFSGTVSTWDTDSPTTGLIDCLAGPDENANSDLAQAVITKRCPKESPVRSDPPEPKRS